MQHRNVYHNLGLMRRAIRMHLTSFYVHNTPEVRNVLAQLQDLGYISRFIAVHEPFKPHESEKIKPRKKVLGQAPYFLVFNKMRLSNKNLPVIGELAWEKRYVILKKNKITNRVSCVFGMFC